jgi:hypothetical protein
VASSEHVLREWKRIVFTSVRSLVTALDEEPDLAAAISRLNVGRGREQSQRLLALSMATTNSDSLVSDDNLAKTIVRTRAQQLLRGDGQRRFDRVVGDLRTASACGLAAANATQKDGAWQLKMTCTWDEGICVHADHVEDRLAAWSAGAEALRRSNNESHTKLGRVGQEMAESRRKRTGKNCYARSGDLAIALDCAADEELVTTDGSFEVLGPVMGFNVVRLPTPPSP